MVGAVINGFDVEGRRFVGSSLDWLTPFNLFCGIGLVVAYTLLGTTWLIMESEGALQQRMRELTRHVLLALMVVIAVVSVWTPLGWQYVADRWFTLPNFFWVSAGSAAGRDLQRADLVPDPQSGQPRAPFPADAGADFPRVQRSGYQPLAEHYSAAYHSVGGRGPACQPAVYAGRDVTDYSGDPGVHRLELLRVPGQGIGY